ncbi:hypothetical protein [Actinoallomurus iriomotensis]|uniref:hypothetical protein n=1 Tax=Actinoallomurus iriomotensis TaxID=478107 RepID=UPI002553CA37|nr:hypothetical protein [Actinoallomurus iriomotensis]
MVAREELGVAAGEDAGTRGFNDVALAVFVVVLPVAAVGATVSLRWTALVAWPAAAGVVALALRRERDRRAQVAWMEGTVLVVQDSGGVRRCDLAAAREVDLTHTAGLRGDRSFRVLVARNEARGPAVRLVLRDRRGRPLGAQDLRLLAAALDASRVGGAVARALREMAEYGRERTSSERVDWTHRTGR